MPSDDTDARLGAPLIERVTLMPEDVLVFNYPGALTQADIAAVRAAAEAKFSGRTIVVLTEGMRLSVLAPVKPAQTDTCDT